MSGPPVTKVSRSRMKRCTFNGSSRDTGSRMKRCTFNSSCRDTGEKKRSKKKRADDELEFDWFAKSGFSLLPMEHPYGGPYGEGDGRELYIRTGTYIDEEGNSLSRRNIMLSNCYSKSNWYLIATKDLVPNDKVFIESHPPPSKPSLAFEEMPNDLCLNAVAVALLPRIYVLGGSFHNRRSRKVFSYDITSPHKGWERRPNMICGRAQPSAVALDGKIYVFGGFKFGDLDINNPTLPYAEVYDPESDKWELLDSGGGDTFEQRMNPYVFAGHALFMDQYNNKHLLVLSYSSMLTYNISSGSFTLRELIPPTHGGAAVVDGILYCYHLEMGQIIAYDIRKAQWFREPVRGLSNGTVLPRSFEPLFLVHIGNGRLCIIHGCEFWSGSNCEGRNIFVHCSVVRVSRTSPSDNGEATLVASVESFKRYIIPGNELQDCLLL